MWNCCLILDKDVILYEETIENSQESKKGDGHSTSTTSHRVIEGRQFNSAPLYLAHNGDVIDNVADNWDDSRAEVRAEGGGPSLAL